MHTLNNFTNDSRMLKTSTNTKHSLQKLFWMLWRNEKEKVHKPSFVPAPPKSKIPTRRFIRTQHAAQVKNTKQQRSRIPVYQHRSILPPINSRRLHCWGGCDTDTCNFHLSRCLTRYTIFGLLALQPAGSVFDQPPPQYLHCCHVFITCNNTVLGMSLGQLVGMSLRKNKTQQWRLPWKNYNFIPRLGKIHFSVNSNCWTDESSMRCDLLIERALALSLAFNRHLPTAQWANTCSKSAK